MFENGMADYCLPMPHAKLYCVKFLVYILSDLYLYGKFPGIKGEKRNNRKWAKDTNG